MRCADWWAFESLIIMSGYAGVAQNAAFVVVANLSAQLFMVAMAFSSTSVILIGSALGSNNVEMAKRWFSMIQAVTVVYSILLGLAVIMLRHQIAAFFTQ